MGRNMYTQYEDSLSHHLMSDVWINNDENGEWASSNFFRWVIDEVNVNMDYDKLLFKDKDSEGLYDIVLPEHTFYRGPNIITSTQGYDQNNNIPPFSFAEYYPRRYDPDYDTRVDTNIMKNEPSSESEDSESYMNGLVFHNSTQDVYIPPESYDYHYDLSGTNNETSSSESDDSERPRSARPLSRLSAKKTGKLWEFLRNLLLDKRTCPSLIKWDNYDEGTFKFVQSEKVAQLWGNRKNNTRMNYEKLSRAMRYYYRSQVLLPVAGKRLVYRFGPQATGWRTKNPIL